MKITKSGRHRLIATACAALALGQGNAVAAQPLEPAASHIERTGATQGLSRMPTPLGNAEIDYPDLAKRAGIGGRVTIAVFVDESGRPTKTQVASREPMFLDIFDDASRRAAMGIRYTPGLDENGKPTAMWVNQPFKYALHGETPPRCTVNTAAHYPEAARAAGTEAVVGVFVNLDANGWPAKSGMAIVGRTPTNASLFDEPAKAALLKIRCRPANRGGLNVPSVAVVDIAFTPPVDKLPETPAQD
ncbi:TonB family protein [Variovorax boronicumulans]|uniref:TonB family protein n=1 Tax=Variovorax boronicumulans TaxID=436515 RepID=A0AAW8CU02_9BURK|nr:TonB family protein [Variovorax boronicumulans]MDP9891331.1 TonB family protein [Variovorax boronicumulans]MDP9992091.1 TonB family protein [Variovorax boronicumulans]MDQ0001986.1 TonB family protein [Variovorax boronicumulans]MDQ0051399.1 TonB family protein [Variovorax boronicumulans]